MQAITEGWREKLGSKVAATQSRDNLEVADAFAQQAYTAVANRDRAIMKDPHLLGFEVIEQNEDNSRLLGAFAFRINGQIALVPVFFLNGQIKGHQMIHMKGVKRFYPNTEKWIAYFLADEGDETGRPIERESRRGRIHFPLHRLAGKMASGTVMGADIDAEIEEVMSEFKEASAEQWDAWEAEAPGKGALVLDKEAMSMSLMNKLFTLSQKYPRLANTLFSTTRHAQNAGSAVMANKGKSIAAGATLAGGTALDVTNTANFSEYPGRAWDGAYNMAFGDLKERTAEAKAEATKLKPEAAALKTEGTAPAPAATEAPRTLDLDWLKDKATNPYVMGGLALGIPATAIVASNWNEKRKKKKDGDLDKESADETPQPWIVKHLWKEAMDEWSLHTPEFAFADAMVSAGMQKQAAELACRMPEFADWIHLAGSLGHAKEAAATVDPTPVLTLFKSPPVGYGEELVKDFYKRGYAILDQRTDKEVRDRIVEETPEISLSGYGAAGMRTMLTRGGPVKVLWGAAGSAHSNHGHLGGSCCDDTQKYQLVCMEGEHKGCVASFGSYGLAHNDAEYPLFQDGIMVEPCEVNTKPTKGGFYALWCKDRFLTTDPVHVRSIKKTGDGTCINMEPYEGNQIIIHPELDAPERRGDILYVGDSVCFIKLKTESGDCPWPRKMPEIWYSRSTIQAALINKTHKVKFARQGRLFELTFNDRVIGRDLTEGQMAVKLASAAGMSVADIHDVVDNDIREFSLVDPDFGKEASAYYDRDIDFDAEFGGEEDFDEDTLMRMLPSQQDARIMAIRHQQPTPERHYLDAQGYGGARNLDHVPDEQIMSMTDPSRQLAEIGQQTGMNTLIDHGALSALTKVFDAGPYIIEYVDQLEVSLDYLARLVFMLFWKPRDFQKAFGEDDLVSLENKLLGVFDSYGDVVLELKQSTGDKARD